MAKSIEL